MPPENPHREPRRARQLYEVHLGVPFGIHPDLNRVIKRYHNKILSDSIGVNIKELRRIGRINVFKEIASITTGDLWQYVRCPTGRLPITFNVVDGSLIPTLDTAPLTLEARIGNVPRPLIESLSCNIIIDGKTYQSDPEPDEVALERSNKSPVTFFNWFDPLDLAAEGDLLFPQDPHIFDESRLQFVIYTQ